MDAGEAFSEPQMPTGDGHLTVMMETASPAKPFLDGTWEIWGRKLVKRADGGEYQIACQLQNKPKSPEHWTGSLHGQCVLQLML
ncbi:MAG: hypothetical protein CMH81_07170 [Nitrospiraceae bacterium]|nr:hypothetical protein [Nitrospiraceae bacterium]